MWLREILTGVSITLHLGSCRNPPVPRPQKLTAPPTHIARVAS